MSDGEDERTGSSDDAPDTAIPLDEMLDLLADGHRRYLLEYLATEADPAVALEDAVTYVTDRLAQETGARPHEDDVDARLHHRHIPRLIDSGLVEFDPRSGTIRYRENERLEAFHEHVRSFQ